MNLIMMNKIIHWKHDPALSMDIRKSTTHLFLTWLKTDGNNSSSDNPRVKSQDIQKQGLEGLTYGYPEYILAVVQTNICSELVSISLNLGTPTL